MGAQSDDARGIRISAFGRSDRGEVRAANQDHLLLADLSLDEPVTPIAEGNADAITVGPLKVTLGDAGVVLMVADGMGGRDGGERASVLAVSAVSDTLSEDTAAYRTPRDLVRRLDQSLQAANRVIHEEGSRDEQYRGMGTTATLAGLLGTFVYVAQVGDSRAYLTRNGTMGRLTRDQSLVQDMIDMGILTEDDAENAPSNQILQAVGVSPTVDPAFTYHELRRGDVVLLCSDGLSRVVGDAEIQAKVSASADCQAMCDELVELANSRGGPDNITVLAARIDGEGLQKPQEWDIVGRRPYDP